MSKLSAQNLRDIDEEIVTPSIEIHRRSRVSNEQVEYTAPAGPMNDDEITDFVLSNPLLDSRTAWNLADPGLLGFTSNYAEVGAGWLQEFRDDVASWASTNEWTSAEQTTTLWTPYFQQLNSEEIPSYQALLVIKTEAAHLISQHRFKESIALLTERLNQLDLETSGWWVLPELYFLLGTALAELKQTERAIVAFNEGLRVASPSERRILAALAALGEQRGYPELAEKLRQEARVTLKSIIK